MSKEITLRLNARLAAKVEKLAALSRRTPSWHIKRMIEDYIDEELRIVAEIRQTMEDAKAGRTKLIPHEVVMAEMEQILREKVGDSEFDRLLEDEKAEERARESRRPTRSNGR